MKKQVFINLPVENVQRSMDFYASLGFLNNPQFSDDVSKCMMWSDSIFVMLLSHEKFATFATKPISDAKSTISGIYSLGVASIEDMNNIMQRGLDAGGKEPHPVRDYGFMQQRTIEDVDGHTWEIFFMDMSAMPTE